MDTKELETTQIKANDENEHREDNEDSGENKGGVSVDNNVLKELIDTIKEQTETIKAQKGVRYVETFQNQKQSNEIKTMTAEDHINKIYKDLLERNKTYINPSPTRDYEQFIYIAKQHGIPDSEIARVIQEDDL